MRAGVVIAGGRSTRFGDADKAVAPLAGTPMIRRVADRLVDVVDLLVVNCRRDQRTAIEDALGGYPLSVRFALDPTADEGPMSGIRTGLREAESAGAKYAAVVACDMPFVEPSFLEELFERAAGHDAAVPRPDEWFQTTQAVYRAEPMADACEAALANGEGKIIAPLFELDYVVVEDAPEGTFRNVNTRAELETAEAEFS
ncbi:molybdenum cofactor guanylyltransferase [Natronomonas salina]|uniref:molybdenum cofactor guanylyltransferase n=1 Tax=Natronomonas salina TaxID=1710540 RepID=UPI0015B62296|nr:molybdenum cofactor guanylyltransferase [Natronomonas salina]QLD87984.1 molybdenum cofactor guanylyltransferase [Natronomonas salina]